MKQLTYDKKIKLLYLKAPRELKMAYMVAGFLSLIYGVSGLSSAVLQRQEGYPVSQKFHPLWG